jgi:cytochrome c peroxidase
LLAVSLAAATPVAPFRWDPVPTPADNPTSKAKVELGRRLFYEADLSIDGTMSCATCHEQRRAFSDGNRTHPGVHGESGRRNVMGLANVAYFSSLTWGDPTHRTLEDQARVPITGEHPVEMGMARREAAITERLGGDACYRQTFARAFPADGGAINLTTVTKALAAFERSLVSNNAPYDRYVRGEQDALTPEARRGLGLFNSAKLSCWSCHAGTRFTDAAQPDVRASYHRLPRVAAGSSDRGLGEVTGRPQNDGSFRTPSLRNVALTGPYLHDGSAATMEAAIGLHFDAGQGPDASEMRALVAFLESLSDQRFTSDPRFSLPKAKRCRR